MMRILSGIGEFACFASVAAACYFGFRFASPGPSLVASTESSIRPTDEKDRGAPVSDGIADRHLSEEECTDLVRGIGPDRIQEGFRNFDGRFWCENPNAILLCREIARRLALDDGFSGGMKRCIDSLNSLALPPAIQTRLLEVALESAVQSVKPEEQHFIDLLKQVEASEACLIMERYVAGVRGGEITAAREHAQRVWEAAGRPLDADAAAVLDRAVLMAFGKRGELEAVVAFLIASRGVLGGHEAMIEVGRLLKNTNDARFRSFLSKLLAAAPQTAAQLCLDADVQIEEVAHLLSMGSKEEHAAFLKTYCSKLAMGAPTDAARFVELVPASRLPPDICYALVGNVLRAGGGNLKEWLSGYPEKERIQTLGRSFWEVQLSENGPVTTTAARAHLELCLGDHYQGGGEVWQALTKLKEKEEQKAFVARLPVESQSEVLKNLQTLWTSRMQREFEADPAETLERIARMDDDARGEINASQLFRTYAREEPEKALQAARQFGGAESVKAVVDGVVDGVLANNSVAALQEKWAVLAGYLSSEADDVERMKVATTVMAQYGRLDPPGGVGALKRLPPGPVTHAAVESLARSWCEADPIAASEWIVEMPAGHARDLAVRQLVRGTLDDPESALRNASQISDSTLRIEAARDVLTAWEATGVKEISEYAEAAGFTVDEIAAAKRRRSTK